MLLFQLVSHFVFCQKRGSSVREMTACVVQVVNHPPLLLASSVGSERMGLHPHFEWL